jgi:hypothetical protein
MLSGLPPSEMASQCEGCRLLNIGCEDQCVGQSWSSLVKSSHFAGPAKLALPRALRPAARGERSRDV